jgi:hypothetical protein
MTNFNHAQIAQNIANQIQDVMVNNGFCNNDANAFRVVMTHWFMKLNRDNLLGVDYQVEAIYFYNEAIKHTTMFGKMMMGAPDGEAGMIKATKLRKAVLQLVAQELEGGHAGDLDLVLRELVQIQLLTMYRDVKNGAGIEAAGLVREMNNACTTAINTELAAANAA